MLAHVNYCKNYFFLASYHVTIAYDDIIIYVSYFLSEKESFSIALFKRRRAFCAKVAKKCVENKEQSLFQGLFR